MTVRAFADSAFEANDISIRGGGLQKKRRHIMNKKMHQPWSYKLLYVLSLRIKKAHMFS